MTHAALATAPAAHPTDATPLAHSVETAARRLGIGRTAMFELIRTRRLVAVRLGRRTLIPEAALHAFLSTLPRV